MLARKPAHYMILVGLNGRHSCAKALENAGQFACDPAYPIIGIVRVRVSNGCVIPTDIQHGNAEAIQYPATEHGRARPAADGHPVS